jgi:cation transport regulator ChaB
MATEERKLTYRDLNQEEKAFWKEAYTTALGAMLSSDATLGNGSTSETAARHAWAAVFRMRGGA